MIRAGLSYDNALSTLTPRSNGPYRAWGNDLIAALNAGDELGESLRKLGERPLVCALVTAGERSGRLPDICREITAIYEHAIATRKLIIGRSIYPLVLVHAALCFPALPGVILGNTPAWTILIGPACLWSVLLLLWAVERMANRSGLTARLALCKPFAGIARPVLEGNLCMVLRAGSLAGLLWPQALRLAADAVGNRHYGKRVADAADQLDAGQLANLSAAVRYLPVDRSVQTLIETGEEAGDLEDTLARCAELQQERARERITWTARIVMGTVYGLALLFAALTVVQMWMNIYAPVLNELN